MSSRFHNKYHRHNHHTFGIIDPRYPDASHDPIASPDSPFLGDFMLMGSISAVASPEYSTGYKPAGIFTSSGTPVALQSVGNTDVQGTLSAQNIAFTGNVVNTYQQPVTATGIFLEVNVNGILQGLRLWKLPEAGI